VKLIPWLAALMAWLTLSSQSQGVLGRLAPGCGAAPTSLDSTIAQGRWWHSSRLLPRLPVGHRALAPADVLVRGRVAEGLGRWDTVDSLLRRARGVDTLPALLALAARADEHAGRWPAAAQKYRRLAALPAADSATHAAAAVRLAVDLGNFASQDSAAAAWRRAAQAVPELEDWFALKRATLERDTALAFASLTGMRTPGSRRAAGQLAAQRRIDAGNPAGALEVYRGLGQPLDVARVEYQMGRRGDARLLADSVLFADPSKPAALLAATFLTEHFDALELGEYLAAGRAYRARGDLRAAERLALAATRTARDTSVAAWLEVASILAARHNAVAALRAVDSAAARAGRRQPGLIGAARVRVFVAEDDLGAADSLLARLVAADSGDTAVAGAMMASATRHRAHDDLAAEVRDYTTLLTRFSGTPAANLARFRLGLVFYAAGATDTARALITAAAALDTARRLGVGPLYWQARVRLERGDTTAAAELRAIAAALPVTYYGVRASELVGDTVFLVDSALAPPRPGSFPAALARTRIRLLAGLGFETEARAEAAGWLGDSAASVQVLLGAADAAAAAGYARESIWLGQAARQRAGLLPAVARALFPMPYAGVIMGEAREQCVDPLLLAALIRQESRFDARAVSAAGARGIAQVMPATGRWLAQRLHLPGFEPSLLFVPDLNIHLGAWFLHERIATDSFPVYATLAAYNAGATRVRSWRRWPEFGDPDLFVERVGISQTNDYVKTVYMSYIWYRRLYAGPAASAPPPASDSSF